MSHSSHQVAKLLDFSFSISSSNEYSGLISFRIDWFDLLAVQVTLKSLLQHHSSKAPILWCSPLWSKSHIHTWLLGKPQLWLDGPSWRQKGYPLQYSVLENSMDGIVHGVAKSWTRLSNFHFGKVMSLLFDMLSRLVIAFLPRNKRLLVSWLQSLSRVILEPKKIKSVTLSIVSLSICHEGMRLNAMIFVFWMLSFKPAFSLFHFLQEPHL